jgi:NADH-quinone oxidoreductase subunit J
VSVAGQLLFWVCAVAAVLSALMTVSMRSPIRAAVGLLIHIISLAGLYLGLHAHLLAAIQLIVYAGAVVVLFIFVIMLIGPTSETIGDQKGLIVRTFAGGLMSMIAGAVTFAVIEYTPAVGEGARLSCPPGQAECGQFGGVHALGQELYVGAALPFELISVLLLVAIVGAIAVARGRTADEQAAHAAKKGEPKRPARRLSADPAE